MFVFLRTKRGSLSFAKVRNDDQGTVHMGWLDKLGLQTDLHFLKAPILEARQPQA